MPKDTGIGASTKRVEDQRFLTGKGRYTSDINLVNQTHAVFVRSDVAHGAIKSIDTAAAAAMSKAECTPTPAKMSIVIHS